MNNFLEIYWYMAVEPMISGNYVIFVGDDGVRKADLTREIPDAKVHHASYTDDFFTGSRVPILSIWDFDNCLKENLEINGEMYYIGTPKNQILKDLAVKNNVLDEFEEMRFREFLVKDLERVIVTLNEIIRKTRKKLSTQNVKR